MFDPINCRELVAKVRLDDAVAHSRSSSARIGVADARRLNIVTYSS